jgi:hypothetical protein
MRLEPQRDLCESLALNDRRYDVFSLVDQTSINAPEALLMMDRLR